jgi:putative MATE family efflux protein
MMDGSTRRLLVLAGPIILGMASQTIMNLVDTAMVGRLGPAAQSAAGLGSFSFWVLANLLIGLGVAVQAMVSRRDGEGEPERAGATLDSGIFLALLLGLPIGYGLGVLAPSLFVTLTTDPDVVEGGSLYLQLRLMGLGVVVANYCFRGFYNGIGQSSTYLASIVLIHVTNILFNWIFIFGQLGATPMGVRGAGMASALAAAVGTVFYTVLTVTQKPVMERYKPFRFRSLAPERLRRMVRLTWPEAVRGILTMTGFLLFLRLHSYVGTRETAAGTILMNIASVGFLPAVGMGLAGATLLGRSIGEGRPDEGRKLVWKGVQLTAAGLVLPCIVLLLFPDWAVGWFTPDGRVVQLARPAVRILGITMVFDALPIVLMFSLQGAGATRWVARVQVVQQYGVLLPLAWLLGIHFEMGILGLWLAMPASRIALAIPAWFKMRGTSWERIEV